MSRTSRTGDVKNTADRPADALLIDTSVWIRADRKRQTGMQERLKSLVIAGTAHICWPIRTELLIGAKDEETFKSLDEHLSALPHLPVMDDIWLEAARLGRKLARNGQTVPLIDLLVSCVAIESGVTLWTVDSDFERVQSVASLQVDWFGMA